MKILLETILKSEEKEVSPTTALNCANYVKNSTTNKRFTQQDGELALKKFVEHKWLTYDDHKAQTQIRLSTRFLAEMDPYLKEIRRKCEGQDEEDLDDDLVEAAKGIGKCQLCQNLVIRSVNCPDCQVNYHLYCIVQTATDAKPDTGRCKACKANVPVPSKRHPHSTSSHLKERKRKSQARFNEED